MTLCAVRWRDTRGSTSMESVVLCAVVAVTGIGGWMNWGASAKDAIAGRGAVAQAAGTGDGSVATHVHSDASADGRGNAGGLAVAAEAGTASFLGELSDAARALPKPGSSTYRGYAEQISSGFHGGKGYALLPTEHIFTERVGDALLHAGEGMATQWNTARRAHFSVGKFGVDVSGGHGSRRGHLPNEASAFLRTFRGWMHDLLRAGLGPSFERLRVGSGPDGTGQLVRLAFDGKTKSSGWHVDSALVNSVVTPKGPGTLYVPRSLPEVERWTARTKPNHVKFFDAEQSALLESHAVAVPRGQILINAGMNGRAIFRDGAFPGPQATPHAAPTFAGARATILQPYGL